MIKHILVTGASSGIGKAIAERLSNDAIVGVHYNSNREGVKDFNGAKYQFDFTVYKGGLIKSFLYDYGKIDVLVNCAGVVSDTPFDRLTIEEYDRVMDINSRAPFLLSKEAFNAMKKKGGKIINISSNVTKFGMGRNNSIHYAASKATLDILTIGLAKMGAKYNILVNSVAPGVIDTEIHKNRLDLKQRKALIPLKRFGKVEDVVGMVEYLISEKGDYITGQIIRISGGE